MKFAYADPPYIGCAKQYYNCPEIDHEKLIRILYQDFTDGWALSCHSPSLGKILNICEHNGGGVRIGAWCKSFCAFRKGVRPAYAWEPVVYFGGRNKKPPVPQKGGKQITPKDFIVERITMKKGLVGAKPERVCRWILDLLNTQEGDDVIDLFPGTGIMQQVAKDVTKKEILFSTYSF